MSRTKALFARALLALGTAGTLSSVADEAPRPDPLGFGGAEIWVDGPALLQPGVDRSNPDAAVGHGGRLIFVWDAFNDAGGDGHDIFLRRFDTAGNAFADPVMVNTLITEDQVRPRVAVATDGSFLVIWQSFEEDPDTPPGAERIYVRSQAYDADGDPVGGEQLLSTLSSGEAVDIDADVAALTGGGYAVVWRSRKSPGLDTDLYIQARLVNPNGTPNGGQFKANESLGPNVDDPAVTELADGGFLVLWTIPEVQGRRFQANGTPVGGDFQVNTFTTGTEAEPDAALHADGRVLAVWKDAEEAGDDREIRARLFSSALVPQGDDFRINTLITGVQDDPKVAAYGEVGFLVVWESEVSAGDDASMLSIQGRLVRGPATFGGAQFQLNEYTMGDQEKPGLSGRGGRAAVAWRSAGNMDTMDDVITGQLRSICEIFCDGFED